MAGQELAGESHEDSSDSLRGLIGGGAFDCEEENAVEYLCGEFCEERRLGLHIDVTDEDGGGDEWL